MNKYMAEPTIASLELRSDSSDWCRNWDTVIKQFYVSAYDASGNGVAGQKISLKLAEGETAEVALDQKNVAITDENGTAILKVTLALSSDNPFAVVASVDGAEGSSSSLFAAIQSEPMILGVQHEELTAPRIPPALDGVIDDNDFANGVSSTIVASNMHRGDTVYLLWGDNLLEQSVSEDAGSYTFELAGVDTTANELLFQNKNYLVRGFVVDVAGNGRYSKQTHVKVNRANGGSGMAYLSPLTITEGTDGIINEAEVKYGVHVVLPNDTLTYTDNAGAKVQIEDPLKKATSASINFVGMNPKDQVINTLSVPLDTPLTPLSEVDNSYTYQERTPPKDPAVLQTFLMSIGEGSVRASYNLTIDGVSYSSKVDTIYEVDVIPPGALYF